MALGAGGGSGGSSKRDLRMNEQIRIEQVRLIGEDGEALGIVKTMDALIKARQAELDLVEISPTATPPVCRIMDYGKFKYQQQKREHDQRKRQVGIELKQLRIKSFKIGVNDIRIKQRQARQFLEAGNRVMLTLMFRAREHSHAPQAEDILKKQFAEVLADIAKVDSPPRKEGRKMNMTLAPLPNLKEILAKRAREEEARRAAALAAGVELPEVQPEPLPDPGEDADEVDDDEDDVDGIGDSGAE